MSNRSRVPSYKQLVWNSNCVSLSVVYLEGCSPAEHSNHGRSAQQAITIDTVCLGPREDERGIVLETAMMAE